MLATRMRRIKIKGGCPTRPLTIANMLAVLLTSQTSHLPDTNVTALPDAVTVATSGVSNHVAASNDLGEIPTPNLVLAIETMVSITNANDIAGLVRLLHRLGVVVDRGTKGAIDSLCGST
jgi:hypothetical protein